MSNTEMGQHTARPRPGPGVTFVAAPQGLGIGGITAAVMYFLHVSLSFAVVEGVFIALVAFTIAYSVIVSRRPRVTQATELNVQ